MVVPTTVRKKSGLWTKLSDVDGAQFVIVSVESDVKHDDV